MNLEEIREAARERDYERDVKPLIVSGSPEPVAFDLRGLAEAMAPKLEALAKQFAVATEKLADILDKAWTDIVAASETAPATGLRGEGASLLLEGMIKVVNEEDEANWDRVADADDTIDVFARAKEMLGAGIGVVSGLPGAVAGAMEMEKKLAEVAALTGSTVESIRDEVGKLARTSTESRGMVLDSLKRAALDSPVRIVAKLYADGALVAVSDDIRQHLLDLGGFGYEVKFLRPEAHQTNAVENSLYKAPRPVQIRIEDGMGTPYVTWDVPDEQALRYARSDFPVQFDFDARLSA
jgi:hypothetical protein